MPGSLTAQGAKETDGYVRSFFGAVGAEPLAKYKKHSENTDFTMLLLNCISMRITIPP